MGKVCSGIHAPVRRELPVHEKAHIEISIYFRSDHSVVYIVVRGIRIPSESSSEVPFVVERQVVSQPGDS